MGKPAAKKGDLVQALDTHIVVTPTGEVTMPFPFVGQLADNLSSNVNIMGNAAAVVGSVAKNQPPHIPVGGAFKKPPSNEGKINKGSQSVCINGKPAARMGDTAITCNDPQDQPNGKIIASGTVFIGD